MLTAQQTAQWRQFVASLSPAQLRLLEAHVASMREAATRRLLSETEPAILYRLQGSLSVLSEFSPHAGKDEVR